MIICRINRLTWHQGTIPEDEIWVKIGGDKGGGSFKMSFQVANISTPNPPENTIVFLMYEGPDSYANLSITLQRFIDQIGALQENNGGIHTCTYTIISLVKYTHNYTEERSCEFSCAVTMSFCVICLAFQELMVRSTQTSVTYNSTHIYLSIIIHTGKHFRLWCTMPINQLSTSPESRITPLQQRTCDMIWQDHL